MGMSAIFTVVQAVEDPILCGVVAAVVETFFDAFFAAEILLRFLVSPRKWKFFSSPHNLIDLIGVVPLVIRLATGYIPACGGIGDDAGTGLILLCIVPVIRTLKTLRRFEKFRLIVVAFKEAFEALPICLFSMVIMTLLFSSIIFIVEPRDNIRTLHDAMWLTIVTATTVGYGDMTPSSTLGSMVVACLVISSVLYLAMPLGIVGQSFTEVWHDRDRILLMEKTRDSLKKWGYEASDIPALFDLFDKDGNRCLDLPEFQDLILEMRIGLTRDRVAELFESFDKDGSGSVDDKEFIRGLFGARAFHEIYTAEMLSEVQEDGDGS